MQFECSHNTPVSCSLLLRLARFLMELFWICQWRSVTYSNFRLFVFKFQIVWSCAFFRHYLDAEMRLTLLNNWVCNQWRQRYVFYENLCTCYLINPDITSEGALTYLPHSVVASNLYNVGNIDIFCSFSLPFYHFFYHSIANILSTFYISFVTRIILAYG